MPSADGSSKAVVKDYFNADAESYYDAYLRQGESRGEIFRERRALVLDLLRAPIGRVLDIGSGPGVFTSTLLDRGGECWVADLSPRMVLAARHALQSHPAAAGVRYLVADIEALPFPEGIFDTVLCVGVLQYLTDIDGTLSQMARVTRPGGQVIVTFPNSRSPLNRLHQGVVSTLRKSAAGFRRLGIHLGRDGSRLTFRPDIPNSAFDLNRIERRSQEAGFIRAEALFHSLHFPFAVPGMRLPLRAWDRLASRLTAAGRSKQWGRETILRLVRA